jgi:hypothetical protein
MPNTVQRLASLLLAVGLSLTPLSVAAQEDQPPPSSSDMPDQSGQPDEPDQPAGPLLTPTDAAPMVCNAGPRALRFLEVRGTGFDPWALQRLSGSLIDGAGTAQATWSSVWVSPQGQLTLEINLCGDPFRGRPALNPGTYTLSVAPGSAGAIAATTIELNPPPEPGTEEMPATATPVPPATADLATTATPVPTATSLPASINLPALATPTPTPEPRTGPGSRQQPFPLGAQAVLADGWQLTVTGVSPDAFDGIQKEFPSARAPASDQRDFIVRIEVIYRGDGSGVFSASRLGLLAANGTTYDQLANGCGLVPDMLPVNLVAPGGQVRGNVCFTIRAADADSVILFDTLGNDNQRPYFALH